MIVSAFLVLDGDTMLDQVVSAARSLESTGVAAVGTLDAADTGAGATHFESTILAGRLAAATTTIGVVASDSALYGFPYHTARRLLTIDHLTAGRSGWLMRTRTAAGEASAYEWRSIAGRGEELHRATEAAEICLELWDSWEDGAQRPDKAAGTFKDDSRIHPIDYRSTAFRVAGPLDVPPSPQRRPVMFAEISSVDEAVMLMPYVDVAIVTAPDVAPATSLADAVPPSSGAVLVAGAIDGASPVMPVESAIEFATEAGLAGIALYLAPTAVSIAIDTIAHLGLSAPAAPRTLAAALRIESTFALGGRAA